MQVIGLFSCLPCKSLERDSQTRTYKLKPASTRFQVSPFPHCTQYKSLSPCWNSITSRLCASKCRWPSYSKQSCRLPALSAPASIRCTRRAVRLAAFQALHQKREDSGPRETSKLPRTGARGGPLALLRASSAEEIYGETGGVGSSRISPEGGERKFFWQFRGRAFKRWFNNVSSILFHFETRSESNPLL